MKSVSITSQVVSLTPALGEVYLIQLLSDKSLSVTYRRLIWSFNSTSNYSNKKAIIVCVIAIIYFTTLLYDFKIEMFSDLKGVMK
jgi:hypothetical protein